MKQLNRKIKILYVLPSITQNNGVAAFVFNYIQHLNMDLFEIDIVASDLRPSQAHISFCENKGIRLFLVKNLKEHSLLELRKDIRNFMREHHDYDILHCNVTTQGIFYLKYAKKYKIPVRIIHSHATKGAESTLKNIRNRLIANLVLRKSNVYFACSDLAGKYLFHKKKYTVINNAISMEAFQKNLELKHQLVKEYHLEDKFILGFVGRLTDQKNVFFLLDILKEVKKINSDAVLVVAGTGVLEARMKEYTEEANLLDSVLYLGEITDSYRIYNLFDCFVLPSKYEGLPVVGIEAQVNELPCFFSDKITTEVKILDTTRFLSIDSPQVWSEAITSFDFSQKPSKLASYENYNILEESKRLESLYLSLLTK